MHKYENYNRTVRISLHTGNIYKEGSNPFFSQTYCLGRKYRWESLQSKYDYHKKAWIVTKKKKVVFIVPVTEEQADIIEFNIGFAAEKILLNEV
jgi:hypothetical protein